jgi:hypothetical protein
LRQLRKTDNGESGLSLYTDKKPAADELKMAVSRISNAFPRMPKEFFILLTERIIANNFTHKRLEDAVNHVMDNFQYKELNISDIIKFDRRIKLYTGKEFLQAQIDGIDSSKFEMREIDGVIFWILKEDLIKTGLK